MGNLHKASKEVSCSRGLVMGSPNPDLIPAFRWASPWSRNLEGSRFPEEQWNGGGRQEAAGAVGGAFGIPQDHTARPPQLPITHSIRETDANSPSG